MDSIADFTLPWRASRNYVLGADMADAMLAALSGQGAITGIAFSVHEMIHAHRGALHAVPDPAALADYPVRLRLTLDGEVRNFGLAALPGDGPVGEPDHEAEIWAAAIREGERIRLSPPFPLSALTTAVSMKKRMMKELFPEKTGKWTFCRLDAPVPPAGDGPIEVVFRQSVRNIHLSEVRFGDAPPARMSFMVTG